MNGIHEGTCTRIIDHESRLGGLEKGSKILESQVSELFDNVSNAFSTVNEVGRKIDKVQFSLENGLQRSINEITQLTKMQSKQIEENRIAREKRIVELQRDLNERLKPLEETSWIPKLINMGIHKAFFMGLVILFMLAIANTAMWGVAKTYIFQEAPGQAYTEIHKDRGTVK